MLDDVFLNNFLSENGCNKSAAYLVVISIRRLRIRLVVVNIASVGVVTVGTPTAETDRGADYTDTGGFIRVDSGLVGMSF